MKKILILGAGQIQVPIIKKAKEDNYFVIVVDYDEMAPGFVYSDKRYIISTNDTKLVLEIALKEEVSGILTTSDFPVRTVAYVCDKMKLTGPSIEASIITTDKYLMRRKLDENGFSVPEYHLIRNYNDLELIQKFPSIIKPTDSSASRGVKRINSVTELRKVYEYSKSYSKSGEVIVEQFLEGKEYSVEALTQNGITYIIAITEKKIAGDKTNSFVEERHIVPAKLEFGNKKRIEEFVTDCINNLGIDNTATHTEIILKDEEIFVLEIASRLGGDYITSDLVPLSTGVDMLENIIKISLGEKVKVNISKNKHSLVQFLTPDNYHYMLKIKEALEKDNLLTRFDIKEFNSRKLENSLDRLGYFICVSDERKTLENYFKI